MAVMKDHEVTTSEIIQVWKIIRDIEVDEIFRKHVVALHAYCEGLGRKGQYGHLEDYLTSKNPHKRYPHE